MFFAICRHLIPLAKNDYGTELKKKEIKELKV
jgi:hypothetical protein